MLLTNGYKQLSSVYLRSRKRNKEIMCMFVHVCVCSMRLFHFMPFLWLRQHFLQCLCFLFSSYLWSLELDPSLGIWKSIAWNLPPSHQFITWLKSCLPFWGWPWNVIIRVPSHIFDVDLFYSWFHLLGLSPSSQHRYRHLYFFFFFIILFVPLCYVSSDPAFL